MTSSLKTGSARYLSQLEELDRGWSENGSSWLSPVRSKARARFEDVGFPTIRDEEWKLFNVGPITKVDFRHAEPEDAATVTADQILAIRVERIPGPQMVFVNGIYRQDLSSSAPSGAGYRLMPLAEALGCDTERRHIEPHLARKASIEANPFAALNTALIHDGAYLRVTRNKVIDEPIRLMYLSTGTGAPIFTHPRNLIVVEENAQVSVIEEYVGLGDGVYFTNPVTEIALEQAAILDLYKLGRENTSAFHVAATAVHQNRDSTFRSHSLTTGGRLVRNDLESVLDGEGASCTLNGLTIVGGDQVVDDHTSILHAKPSCTSNELYKTILDGKARGIFNGKVLVAKDAQQSDAKQSNRNLLLSDKAFMHTKPQLEIYADDVKAAHGATIGQLDAESLFYLRSRGIDKEHARSILAFAFADDVIDRFPLEPLRKAVECMLLISFPTGFEPGDFR